MPLPFSDRTTDASAAEDERRYVYAKRGSSYELLPVILVLLTCYVAVFYNYLLCNKLYLFKDIGSDSLNVFYPKYVQLSRYLRSEGIPGWSFNVGLGQDTFPLSLGNPFELFVVLFPPHLVGYAIVFAECGKCVLSGMLIYKALRIASSPSLAAMSGSVLFAFSGYMVVGGQWHIFSVEAFHVALLIYSFEIYLAEWSRKWLIGAFFLIAAHLPFNLYLSGFFLSLYAFMRLRNSCESFEKARKVIFDMLFSLLAGIGLASFFFLPALSQMMQAPRGAGALRKIIAFMGDNPFRFDSAEYYGTLCLRMFSSHLEGINTGWGNYLEAPLMYIGLPVILLVPLSFIGTERRYRTGVAIVLLIVSVIMLFPAFRLAFWLGTNVYVRFFALMLSSFLLVVAMQSLRRVDEWGRKHVMVLAATFLACLVPLFFLKSLGINVQPVTEIRNIILLFLIIHAVLIAALALHPKKKVFMLLLLVVSCAEVVVNSSYSVRGRPVVSRAEYRGKVGYNDFSVDALRLIKGSDRDFFRVVKEYGSTLAYNKSINDAMVQDYYGVSVYQSFNNPYFIRFLHTMGVISTVDDVNSRWISVLNEHPLLLTLLNNKYILTNKENSFFLNNGYAPLATVGDVNILKNGQVLPFGYSYDHFMSKSSFDLLSPQEKQIAVMRACFIEDDAGNSARLIPYTPARGNRYTPDDLKQDVDRLSLKSLKITKFSQELIEGELSFERPRLVLFSMPFDKGWLAYVDGKPEKIVLANGGLAGVLVEPGEHKIKLVYSSPWRATGMAISLMTALILVIIALRRKAAGVIV